MGSRCALNREDTDKRTLTITKIYIWERILPSLNKHKLNLLQCLVETMGVTVYCTWPRDHYNLIQK